MVCYPPKHFDTCTECAPVARAPETRTPSRVSARPRGDGRRRTVVCMCVGMIRSTRNYVPDHSTAAHTQHARPRINAWCRRAAGYTVAQHIQDTVLRTWHRPRRATAIRGQQSPSLGRTSSESTLPRSTRRTTHVHKTQANGKAIEARRHARHDGKCVREQRASAAWCTRM